MLFNSYPFIFIFLPIVFIVYFTLNKLTFVKLAKVFLILASLYFYSYWNEKYLPLILFSILFNYLIGKALHTYPKKALLFTGIAVNLGLLGYYKYADFFISNVNAVLGVNLHLLSLALPLAISFFTFQQIGFLVDSYRGETKEYGLLEYSLFVTFFPQLIAGPIVHHKQVIPQYKNQANNRINARNIALGLYIFFIGLFKKVVIADTLSLWATRGFDQAQTLTFVHGWITSLSYTFQLYFDFSGYCDMAIGAALLLNIKLPINFNSPYKAVNIQDFWKRWHITLGKFLTRYLYIPLGGNQAGKARTYINLLIVFLLSGLWHGAGWTFVFWGFLHGVATVIHRFWKDLGYQMNKYMAWFITFQFVNVAWVFFRAKEWADALKVIKAMLAWEQLNSYFILGNKGYLFMLLLLLVITIGTQNAVQKLESLTFKWSTVLFLSVITVAATLSLHRVSAFLYFNF